MGVSADEMIYKVDSVPGMAFWIKCFGDSPMR